MRFILCSFFCGLLAIAQADEHRMYAGVAQTEIDTETEYVSYFNYWAETKQKSNSVIAGYAINQNVAFEVRLNTGASEESIPAQNGWPQTTYSVDNMDSLLARFSIDAWDRVRPYIVIGKTKFESSVTFPDSTTVTSSQDGLTSGLGIAITLYDELVFAVEKTKFVHDTGKGVNDDSVRVEGTSMQLIYFFP